MWHNTHMCDNIYRSEPEPSICTNSILNSNRNIMMQEHYSRYNPRLASEIWLLSYGWHYHFRVSNRTVENWDSYCFAFTFSPIIVFDLNIKWLKVKKNKNVLWHTLSNMLSLFIRRLKTVFTNILLKMFISTLKDIYSLLWLSHHYTRAFHLMK